MLSIRTTRLVMPMLNKLIPAYELEMENLGSVATAGHIIGFGYTMSEGVMFMENRFPPRWQRRYDGQAYLFRDPVVTWFTNNIGTLRWSELDLPDTYGVLADAKRYGLAFGSVFSIEANSKRHFMSVARGDRDLTDAEVESVFQRFTVWSQCVSLGIPKLELGEIEVLRCIGEGMDKADAAAALDVSISTIKLRQASAMKKLQAKSLQQAIKFATSARLI